MKGGMIAASRLALALRPRPYELPPLPADRCYVEEEDPNTVPPVHVLDTADPYDTYSFRASGIVHVSRSPYQSIVVADTLNYGRVLILDGAIQSAEFDEELYHEMLVQPAMLMHEAPRDVLVIGGGEGATLREVLAHGGVRRAVMVDLDQAAVEACREHLPRWHRNSFSDPRVEMNYCDGRAYVEEASGLFDVVIIDVVDMLDNGPAQRLYTREFYETLKSRLRPGGIIAVQGLEFSSLDFKGHTALHRTLRTVFRQVHSYRCAIPSFLGTWGFLIASDFADPADFSPNVIDQIAARRLPEGWLSHLDGAFLQAAFCHDRETRFLLSLSGPILEDGTPFVPPPDIEDVEPVRSGEN